MNNQVPVAVFRLGGIVATPNALQSIPNEEILKAIQRHQAGDWGSLDSEDRNSNDRAQVSGDRLYQKVVDDLDQLLCAVGLKAT